MKVRRKTLWRVDRVWWGGEGIENAWEGAGEGLGERGRSRSKDVHCLVVPKHQFTRGALQGCSSPVVGPRPLPEPGKVES